MSTTPSGLANIGKSVTIKGELSGSEDIYLDGQVEGSIQLAGNSVTVGPNGRVKANITAKNLTVGGTLDGNVHASERTELRKTAVVNGDVQTKRIAIEEGAYFKGKLEILTDVKPATPNIAAAAAVSTPAATPSIAHEDKK
ncbi:MAG TPA: polymer-forming cytoskeletal protein [Terriglobales bacterium]|jgi:cytoskeletal protein CcmA (bactofilin family)|nr:polymer-forming cytoskeletal protein [Terriglobales bacterium]